MQLTRRDVLAAGAGTVGAGLGAGRAHGQAADSVTVATRNCYLGANLFRLLVAATEGSEAVDTAVGDLLRTVDRSHVPERLGAIAAEIERTDPDLIGLQEVALIRTGEPTAGTTPTATEIRYDFRETLTAALDERGLPYRVVDAVTTTDIQLPATVDGERRAVRLTDRDLLLAHESVATSEVATGRFDAAVSLSDGDRSIAVERGYLVSDASVGGTRLTVCNTHLESVSAGTRLAQAREIETLLSGRADPVALVGDLNSGPGGSRGAYDHLTGPFRDAATGVGNTCCHAAGLRNDAPSLTARIDHVLVRGGLGTTDATRVGAESEDRIAVDDDRLWPSDHAGVVATLTPGAAETATQTATETATPTPTGTPEPSPTASDGVSVRVDDDTSVRVPGFGVGAGVASVVTVALAARRLVEDD
ncbi:endonuclease/exonuclease/phosphatase family protein [Haloplanus natans]|uniref:endonuclease/exonuclease/phosphatase family protein n=1 Tax=Haloplanus natans TaxID=376171 RepID=UPI0006782D7E|nr:endonuclease/exonuclease/phosphatase family protein [Haloplanus natans]